MIAFRILLFISFVLFSVYRIIRLLFPKEEGNESAVDLPSNAHVVKRIHRILLTKNGYYKKLSRKGHIKFISRVLYLLHRKRFRGYHDLKVSFTMRVLVLSAQVQLTFGYKRFSLPKFSRFILYPEQFYSRYFETEVKGLTTGMGFVTLSWRDVDEGFEDERDNLNLAMHELAHALEISVNKLEQPELEISRLFARHEDDVLRYFERFKQTDEHKPYLREYAMANQHEFFSVVVEHFFETPQEFQERLSPLYSSLCKLLNQNPLNVSNDYQYP